MALFRRHASHRSIRWAVAFVMIAGAARADAQGNPRIQAPAATEDPQELARRMAEYEKGSQKRSREGRDGVYLEITYWRAKQPGTSTPVVVLLPMKGRTQRDWYPFAYQLYEDGFAVVTFDFRGHGESTHINPTNYKSPELLAQLEAERRRRAVTGQRVVPPGTGRPSAAARTRGDTITYQDDFRNTRELGEMMVRDLEDIKRYLLELHNNREFNIQQMGIVAAEMSCNVALKWIAEYEYRERRQTGWTQQGGDLAALVLISPSVNYEGFRAETNLGRSAEDLPILLVSSSDSRVGADGVRIARSLKTPDLEADDSKRRSPGYYRPDSGWIKVNSTLQGTALFRPAVDQIDSKVRGYLEGRLRSDRGRTWKERRLDVDLGFGSGR